jgi:hypothetical protein
MPYNAIQCNAIQCNAMQCNTIQYKAIQYNTRQGKAMMHTRESLVGDLGDVLVPYSTESKWIHCRQPLHLWQSQTEADIRFRVFVYKEHCPPAFGELLHEELGRLSRPLARATELRRQEQSRMPFKRKRGAFVCEKSRYALYVWAHS